MNSMYKDSKTILVKALLAPFIGKILEKSLRSVKVGLDLFDKSYF